MKIEAEELSWAVGGTPVVRGVSMSVGTGETIGLIGPNGSGKSSLLRCLAGLRTPDAGRVRHDGTCIRGRPARRIARRVAFVAQDTALDADLPVAEVVGLGRLPFRDPWRGPDAADRAIVAAALGQVGLTGLAGRPWRSLSGGERQRAHIARAFAQQPDAILLDEPTNHLDIRHQLELMELLSAADRTAVIALHDLNLAARYCTRLLLLHDGRLHADGPPRAVLTPANLAEVFGVGAEFTMDGAGRPVLAYASLPRPDTAAASTAALP
ncbi:ABC transporter ATP-binding protein [Yinghuangia soli]|uniref:ABC transporter ATP-binding protein n=1 Tax=Yinghuangia soli TaxID=2908204 RepID=A0AA41PW94_9ACTN|nr:ABC transporter ATP-binding protein [Yinghuangia soli]MCF2526059.1 ABC transporter ATP-binding protein [Yinghuangia soli]